jgi:hypothetical protein
LRDDSLVILLLEVFDGGARVNFQITVLKVLAGHPEGRASLADLKHYVAVLANSGTDWSQRMKCLAARAPGLDIFSSGYVLRDASGWEITTGGSEFLKSIETPADEPVETASPPPVVLATPDQPSNVIQLADHKIQRAAA